MIEQTKSDQLHSPKKRPTNRLTGTVKTMKNVGISTKGFMQRMNQRLKGVNIGALEDAVRDVASARGRWWEHPDEVRKMASNFARRLRVEVSEERLNGFVQSYLSALKDPPHSVDPVKLAKRYGQGKIDISELRKLQEESTQALQQDDNK